MNNHTVKQLKAIAKERGIRGYYQLTKADMIHAIDVTRLEEQRSNIFDEPIPNDLTSVYNQHLEDHQMQRQNLSKIKKNSLIRIC